MDKFKVAILQLASSAINQETNKQKGGMPNGKFMAGRKN